MIRRRKRHISLLSLPAIAGGAALPFPAGLPDGAFPASWTAPNWTISGGKGVCTPTLGAELLTDGGLEGTYTSGLCAALSKSVTPTVAQSADVHGGAKAQSFLATANFDSLKFANYIPTANLWYLFTGWGKRTAGTYARARMHLAQTGGKPYGSSPAPWWNDAAYAQRQIAKWAIAAQTLGPFVTYQAGAAMYDTVILDDFSLKAITQATMLGLKSAGASMVKARYTWNGNGVCGVVARANAASDPDTFLIAYYFYYDPVPDGYNGYCALDKCVAGTYTNLIAAKGNNPTAGAGSPPTADQWLEIRCSGNTVQLFHNGIQVGTDQTVADVAGDYAGVFQSGGAQLEGFICG